MHGINFGCKCEYCAKAKFPPAIARMFAQKVKPKNYDLKRGQYFWLKGVAQTMQEMLDMESVVKNGNRDVHVVIRHTAGGDWYGIYTKAKDVQNPEL